jgi:hypothetical protein
VHFLSLIDLCATGSKAKRQIFMLEDIFVGGEDHQSFPVISVHQGIKIGGYYQFAALGVRAF